MKLPFFLQSGNGIAIYEKVGTIHTFYTNTNSHTQLPFFGTEDSLFSSEKVNIKATEKSSDKYNGSIGLL